MAPVKYRITAKAAEDLENIWLYTRAHWSVEQADRYLGLLFDEFNHLAAAPASGFDRSHIRPGYRCSFVKSHVVFYRVSEQNGHVDVIRVLHQRMDMEGHLREPLG